ncbi:hypothetical protein VMCG_09404 [Cytospora schulzeri]|uniref:Translation initiation factor IF-2, mitochondrial n=1 Tax=Cytospora schulzeri TaxID=448051 RepID=A0A423VIE1_9PEZI|nr:hypothetical protein VMCG_09404 [Valsa malicola]
MLRSQVQRQGSFYVCASCRRQHQQNLAQQRSNGRILGSVPLSTSRLLSSSVLSASRRPGSRTSQNDALPTDHHDGRRSPQSTTTAQVDVRHYSSYGKFGSGTLPGQSNADWAKAGPTIPGTTGPTPSWGGGMRGGRIQPAQGTSKAKGAGIQPAKATSIPGNSGNGDRIPPAQPTTTASGGAASSEQGTTPAQSSTTVQDPAAWVGRTNTLAPQQRVSNEETVPERSTITPAQAGVPEAFSPQDQETPAHVQSPAVQDGVPETSTSDSQETPARVQSPEVQNGVPETSSSESQETPAHAQSPAMHHSIPETSSSENQETPAHTSPAVQNSIPGTTSSQIQETPAPTPSPAVPTGVANNNQTASAPAIPKLDAIPDRSTASPTLPTAFSSAGFNRSGPTTAATPNAPWNTGASRPFKRTSGIPTIPGKSTLGQISIFDAGLLPHEKLAIQGAEKPKPPPPPPPPAPRAPEPQPRTQNPVFGEQDFSRKGPMRAAPANRPPLPPGSEFPQLRRKWPNVDEFEALSPFNLPPKGTSKQEEAAPSAAESSFVSAYDRPKRKPPSGLHRSDRYPTWGKPSDLGAVAPEPRDPLEKYRMGRSRDLGDVAPDPVEAISGKSSNVKPPVRSQAPEWLDVPGSSQPSPAPPPAETPAQASRSQTPLAPPKPQDGFAAMEKAIDSQTAGDPTIEPIGDDWGLLESDFAPPEELHLAKRREGDRKHPEYRELEWEDHPRAKVKNLDIDVDRRGRGRDPEPSKPKKRSSNRRNEYDDDDDSGFDYEAYLMRKEEAKRRKEEKKAAKEALTPKTILLPEYIAVYDLAEALGVRPQQFLEDLSELGFENILNDSVMTGETAALVAAEYGFDPTVDAGDEDDLRPRPTPEDPSALPARPPIVTIMGHVDHGKTTMLDWLRKSSVAAQEHGGITQHIGAFSVRLSTGKVITFLDTPGHAAFLSMRQRGANVTDIVILVVAVDDSVKPQTLEALKHAQNAKVPIIVAINKIDKDPSGIEQVKQDLAANGIEIEDFGGDVQVVPVSGKTGQGMNDLEESILTLSEILDVRAEMDGMAEGWILEASVKKHHGKAATVLVKRGTMRVGDLVVAGTTYARIRMMRNEAGVAVQEAGPGTPVEVLGWRDSPMAGDMVLQAPDEDRAQAAVEYRQEAADREKAAAQKGEEEVRDREKAEQEALERMMAEGGEEGGEGGAEGAEEPGTKVVNTIIRGDVMGSVEAVCTAVMEIGSNEVRPRILRSSPGQIAESDIDLAAAAKASIINFNNDVPGAIRRKAEDQGVRILDHTIIYALVDDVKQLLSQQLAPITSQRVLAEAEVLEIFPINVKKRFYKNIAGVRVRTGAVTRSGLYRVMRDGEKIHDGKLDALKQGKKDASEMRKGTECGMSFEDYDDFKAGDIVQLYEEITEKRYL